jgi:hypothetical protein
MMSAPSANSSAISTLAAAAALAAAMPAVAALPPPDELALAAALPAAAAPPAAAERACLQLLTHSQLLELIAKSWEDPTCGLPEQKTTKTKLREISKYLSSVLTNDQVQS